MKKIVILILSMLLYFNMTMAQTFEKRDLSKYKYRFVRNRALGFTINGSNQSVLEPQKTRTNLSNNFDGSGSVWLRTAKSSKRYLGNTELQANGKANDQWRNRSSNSMNSPEFENSRAISFHSTNQFYRDEGRFTLVSIGASKLNNRSAQSTFQVNNLISRQHQESQNINVELGLGNGRLEMIDNAALTIFLLKALEKAGQLKGSVSDAQILKLTDLLNELNNKRLFDSRMRRIYILEKIDSLLESEGLISVNVKSFAIISDNLFFTNLPTRLAGKQFSFSVFADYSEYRRNSRNTSTYFSNGQSELNSSRTRFDQKTFQSGLKYTYSVHKPLSLYWHRAIDNQIVLAYEESQSTTLSNYNQLYVRKESNKASNLPYLNLLSTYSYTYTPSTRTDLTLQSRLGMTYATTRINTFSPLEPIFAFRVQFAAYLNYWLNPKVQSSLGANLSINSKFSNHSSVQPNTGYFNSNMISSNAYFRLNYNIW